MASKLSLECLVEKLESLIASLYSTDSDGNKLCFTRNELKNEAKNDSKIIAAKSICSEIRAGGLAALVKIATYNYEFLKEVMDEIEMITIEAIKSDHQQTHIQALEFWKAVSQNETPRDSEGRLINGRGTILGNGFSQRALGRLVPALLHVLKRGDFIQNTTHGACNRDEPKLLNEQSLKNKDRRRFSSSSKVCTENWIPPKEVIIYLSELCESFPTAIDMHILPHVPSKLKHENWKERNIALWSFLVFLQQMKHKHARNVLPNYFPLIVNAVQDRKSSRIRNTALWVLSWMLDKCPWLVLFAEQKFLKRLVSVLLNCLKDKEGRVAPTSCITIVSLVRASYVLVAEQDYPKSKPQTFWLSPFYDQIADALVVACNRRLIAAFEALRQVLVLAPDDCYWIVLDTFDALLAQLRKMIALPELHPVGCDCHETVQQILCAVLCSVFKSMPSNEEPTVQLAWKFMKCIKDILKQFPLGKARENAALAASAIVSALDWKVKNQPSWEIFHFLTASNVITDIDMKTYNL